MYVKIPAGNKIELNVSEPYTTESAKQEIARKEGTPAHLLQLNFSGKVLEDGHTFDEYGIQYGSTLYMYLVDRPGSKYILLRCVECVILFFAYYLPVFIQTPMGDIFLESMPSYTIGQVKSMIQGILSVALKLIFAGQLLEDKYTLSYYNIPDGSVICKLDIHVIQ